MVRYSLDAARDAMIVMQARVIEALAREMPGWPGRPAIWLPGWNAWSGWHHATAAIPRCRRRPMTCPAARHHGAGPLLAGSADLLFAVSMLRASVIRGQVWRAVRR